MLQQQILSVERDNIRFCCSFRYLVERMLQSQFLFWIQQIFLILGLRQLSSSG